MTLTDVGVGTASSQELVELLQARRHRAVAEQIVHSGDGLDAKAPELLPVDTKLPESGSLSEGVEPDGKSTFNLFKVRRIPKLGRPWFTQKFAEVEWVFLGSNDLSSIDTTFTWRLRAMLEAEHGSPTQTLTDLGHWKDLDSEQYIQFEYWFVVNNRIPFLVVDTNGPFERGIVVATHEAYAPDLKAIRNAIFEPLIEGGVMTPFVDYYYDEEYDTWYKTGFDGDELFVQKINPSQIGNSRPVIMRK